MLRKFNFEYALEKGALCELLFGLKFEGDEAVWRGYGDGGIGGGDGGAADTH